MGCLKLHSEENNTPMRVVGRNGKRVGTSFPDDITNAITYNLENQIGSSVARLDTNGTIIDREEYYPFGDSSLRTFTKKRYRYVGKEKDLESGLYYYGARYYAAWICRFMSIDPLAHDYPFYTPYNYAGNKPINKIDIDGMQEEGGEKKPENNNASEKAKIVIDRKSDSSSLDNIRRDVNYLKEQNVSDGDQYTFMYGGDSKDIYTYTYQQSINAWHGVRSAIHSGLGRFWDTPLLYAGSTLNKQTATANQPMIAKQDETKSNSQAPPIQPSTTDVGNITPPAPQNANSSSDNYGEGATYSMNNIFLKSDVEVQNKAFSNSKSLFTSFEKYGFGAGLPNQKSLVGSVSIHFWNNQSTEESSKIQMYISSYIKQIKSYFGQNIQIDVQNMNIPNRDSGNSVGISINRKK